MERVPWVHIFYLLQRGDTPISMLLSVTCSVTQQGWFCGVVRDSRTKKVRFRSAAASGTHHTSVMNKTGKLRRRADRQGFYSGSKTTSGGS